MLKDKLNPKRSLQILAAPQRFLFETTEDKKKRSRPGKEMKCGGIGVKRIRVSCGKGKIGCMVVKGHGSYRYIVFITRC